MSDNNDFILRRQITPAAWQACLEEGRCFIVADASLNEAVPWLAGRYTGSEQHACLLWGETFRIHASAAPYCIPAGTDNWQVLSEYLITRPDWGIAMQLEWYFGAMTPEHQAAELVGHLRRCLLVTAPQQEPGILRLYSWQVLSPLLAASTHAQACRLYGPVRCFFNIKADGDIQSAALAGRVPPDNDGSPSALSERQWQAINRPRFNGSEDRFAAHLRRYHPRWQHSTDAELLDFIRTQTEQAKAYGFSSEQENVLWLALSSELPPGFAASGWAKEILAQPAYQGGESRITRLYRQALRRMQSQGSAHD